MFNHHSSNACALEPSPPLPIVMAGIPFDILIMGFADTGRVLINDINWQGKVKAHAVNLQRDEGFENVDWEKYEL